MLGIKRHVRELRKWSIGFQKDFTIASYTVAR